MDLGIRAAHAPLTGISGGASFAPKELGAPKAPTGDGPQRMNKPADHDHGVLPSSVLKLAVEHARRFDPKAVINIDDARNRATFVSGNFSLQSPGVVASQPESVAGAFLEEHGLLFGVDEAAKELKLVSTSSDELGMTHLRYEQVHGKLPVFNNEMIVHLKGDTVRAAGGHLLPSIDVPESARLSADEAIARASSVLRHDVKTMAQRLGVYASEGKAPRLAYELEVAGIVPPREPGANVAPESAAHPHAEAWRFYIDAENGSVLDRWTTHQPIRDRSTHDAQNASRRPGKQVRKENGPATGDSAVDKAHDYAGAVYDYFKEGFGRDSLDNKGMKLVSTVHYGRNYNNAFWDGSQMTYGDGDGKLFSPLSEGLDVVGHEMTHGVTERTAGLQYFRQSGALNESWSDVMGELIEQWHEKKADPNVKPDWLVGEDVFTPGKAGDALRSIKAPGTGYDGDPQPAHMRDYNNTTSDNGGVHINSGIPNKAAYEAAQKIGGDKVAKIWYRTLTNYFTRNSQFKDASNMTLQSARDLFGDNSAEVAAVRDAWTSVGLAPAR